MITCSEDHDVQPATYHVIINRSHANESTDGLIIKMLILSVNIGKNFSPITEKNLSQTITDNIRYKPYCQF